MPLPADITIPEVTPWTQFVANGTQTQFPIPWWFGDQADLTVYTQIGAASPVLQTLNVDYTVTREVEPTAGGTVTFTTAPVATTLVTIYRDIAVERLTDFVTNGELRARLLNTDLDAIVSMIQDRLMDVARSIRIPLSSDFQNIDTEINPVADGVLKWNSTATALVTSDLTFSERLLTLDWQAALGVSTDATRIVEANVEQIDGTSFVQIGGVAEVQLVESALDYSPSNVYTIEAGGDVILEGVGTATALVQVGSGGKLSVNVAKNGQAGTANVFAKTGIGSLYQLVHKNLGFGQVTFV